MHLYAYSRSNSSHLFWRDAWLTLAHGTSCKLSYSDMCSILLVQACLYMARVHMSCSLHYIKSRETKGVIMFSTETSRDVGMVDCVWCHCTESPTGGKSPGTRMCIPWHCSNPVNIHLQDTYFGYAFTISTSGNILMWLGLVYQSAFMASYS